MSDPEVEPIRKWRQEIVNFMTPHTVILGKKFKIAVFLKKSFVYSQALIRQTNYVVMMTMQGRV